MASRSLTRVAQPTARGDVLRYLMKDRAAIVGLAIAAAFVLSGIVGPALAPYDPYQQELRAIEQGPSAAHWLGTDQLGRDMLSRILGATRTGLLVASIATGISVTVGVTLGAVGGYYGGWVDGVVSRMIEFVLAFPALLLALFVDATLRPATSEFVAWLHETTGWAMFESSLTLDYVVVVASLGVVLWGSSARLIRGQVLSLREREYVIAAVSVGATGWWIVRRHMVPNALGPVIVSASLNFGGALLLEAALSYLGIGIRPPGTSIGAMINANLTAWRYQPHLVLAPASVLALVLVGFTLLGDALNDALDPRRRSRMTS